MNLSFRERILARAGDLCERCKRGGVLHLHHIKRRSQGGKDTEDNFLALCWRCHMEEHTGLKVRT